MKRWILVFMSLVITSGLFATNDTIIIKRDRSSEIIELQLDSLVHQWYIAKSIDAGYGRDSSVLAPVTSFADSVYRERLQNIHSVVSLPYNSIVRNHIHVYTNKKRDKFEVMLGMREYYFPMIEDIFDYYGLLNNILYIKSNKRKNNQKPGEVKISGFE